MGTVLGFSCFSIEHQLKCLLFVFLGSFLISALSLIFSECFSRFNARLFLQISRQSQFCSDLPSCRQSSFLSQQKRFELEFCHGHLLGFQFSVCPRRFQQQRRHHIPIHPIRQRLCSHTVARVVWLQTTQVLSTLFVYLIFDFIERTASTAL